VVSCQQPHISFLFFAQSPRGTTFAQTEPRLIGAYARHLRTVRGALAAEPNEAELVWPRAAKAGDVVWRFVNRNGVEIARSATGHASFAEAHAAAELAVASAEQLWTRLGQDPVTGAWAWALCLADAPILTNPRPYATARDAVPALSTATHLFVTDLAIDGFARSVNRTDAIPANGLPWRQASRSGLSGTRSGNEEKGEAGTGTPDLSNTSGDRGWSPLDPSAAA
jgi:hypothetical protein